MSEYVINIQGIQPDKEYNIYINNKIDKDHKVRLQGNVIQVKHVGDTEWHDCTLSLTWLNSKIKEIVPLSYKQIKEECISGKHLLVHKSGNKHLYLGFTRGSKLVTDSGNGESTIDYWSEAELVDYYIEEYNE